MERTHGEKIHGKNRTRIVWDLCVGGTFGKCNRDPVRKTTGLFTNRWRIKMALESYFDEHVKDVWSNNWMNPEVQTTLFNTSANIDIASILMSLREQLKENDRLNAVEKIDCRLISRNPD